tara:strand:+ start:1793 stop:2077 length:285 start_codon:yes stop_codon:yes gene_type:complete
MIINDEDWERGNPGAPPHVQRMWELCDWDSFPDDASDEKPYLWHPIKGAWVTIEDAVLFDSERELAALQNIDQSLLSVVEVTELQARIKKLETS